MAAPATGMEATIRGMTPQVLQQELQNLSLDTIAQVQPEQVRQALRTVTPEQLKAALALLQTRNLGDIVARLTDEQLQAAVECPQLQQFRELTTQTLGITHRPETYQQYLLDERRQKILQTKE
eukprot:TRINITY_DN3871_c0_g1_i1.p2 TRINITY_DN3871_c0_g1~~TRINITY_DN3871_c0_g1_i1.p2  ORF type:complete len:144 (-),score=37.92 TRINITY_DN3871_c0_g1_i1:13-381(-)